MYATRLTLLFHRYKMVRAIKWVDEVSRWTLFPPNFLTLSLPHTLTSSHSPPHTLTFSHSHFLTLILEPSLTCHLHPSHLYPFTVHPLTAPTPPPLYFSPPLTHSIPYSHPHTLTHRHSPPHTLTRPSDLHSLIPPLPHHHPFTQVVEDAPYVTTLETLDKYNCDFCAHGGEFESSPPMTGGVRGGRERRLAVFPGSLDLFAQK